MNPEAAPIIAGYLLQGLENEHGITKKVLAAVPDAKLAWRPHAKGRTTAELAWHIVFSEIWMLDGLAAGKFAMEKEPNPPQSVKEILAYYEKHFPASLAKVKALAPQALGRNLDFAGAFNFPAFVYMSFASNHTIHHRGQLSAYLRAMGERVPDIYGGSADEPFVPPKAQSAG